MASLTRLIKDFARSPKGQQLIEQVKEQASKPENRRKLKELQRRYAKRR
jgi:Zn-dependent M32 family carboxypeptidase